MTLGSLTLTGCANIGWNQRMQNGFFDKDGNKAGFSGSWPCIKQALKETYPNALERQVKTCNTTSCHELAETCMKEKGYTEAKTFETTEGRMAIYRKAYEEGWIKPGMTRLEVITLIGAPQIATVQLIPPRKIWMYCRSATKTAFVGFNWVFQITWVGDGEEYRVESAERVFKM
jgi:hypothetical protein